MTDEVARAYDRIAAEYDSQLQGDEWMRRILWHHYLRVFRPGQSVLDVSCGTGTDALFLARSGIQVTAIDISPGMVAQLRVKVAREGLEGWIESQVMDLANINSWPPRSFDGILSAFAGLSSVPDPAPFAASASQLLRPGGHLIVHMLSRCSLWERVGLLKRAQWAAARRLNEQKQRDFTIGGERVPHHMYLPGEAYRRFFAHYFVLKDAYSLGSLRPPHTVHRIPSSWVGALGVMDGLAGRHRPFVNWGRFFVLDLVARPQRLHAGDEDPLRLGEAR